MTVTPFKFLTVLAILFANFDLRGQVIVDSCFTSITKLGLFLGSDDLQNLCMCSDRYYASDLMEWNPVSLQWEGRLPHNPTLNLPPPPNDACFLRGIWMGSESWTENGEAFGLRLDKPLVPGNTYEFTFQYAADGYDDNDGFQPIVYSCSIANLFFATPIDTLPSANSSWITNTLTFTATEGQRDHTWLVLHTVDASGTILSNCKNKSPLNEVVLPEDTVLCENDRFMLRAQGGEDFTYYWNTQDTTSAIEVSQTGQYSVKVSYHYCSKDDAINVNPIDCEVRLTMPNVFTPNGDDFNPLFVPKEHNFIRSGNTRIYNRWGEVVFREELFTGWDGKINDAEASTGVYFYQISYEDVKGRWYEAKGIISLRR